VIIDSHCHAWRIWPYDTTVPDPASRGTAEQLLFEMDRNGVDRAVVICARIDHNPDGNDYGMDAARRWPDRLVGFPDVDSAWSPEYHTAGAATRLSGAVERWGISGFTHYLGSSNDGWLRSQEAEAFFTVAAQHDLIASIPATGPWLADLRAVARAFPTMPILLHHLGMVRASDPDLAPLAALVACANEPNIPVKVSGFYYGSGAIAEYPYADQLSVFRAIVEAFGPRRLAWGSDYPVSPWVACTYRQTLDVVRVHAAHLLPGDAMDWVMGRTLDAVLRTRRPIPLI
jgi:predicted TIM-barrel fold metal-dependent hydrolase